jgi:hypothetical protein
MAVQGVPIENPAALFRATHGAPMRTVSGRTGRRQMRINRPCAQRAERIRAACRAAALRDPRHVSVVRAARATRLRCLPRGDPPPNPRLTQLMPKKGGLAMARKCNCTELLRAGLTSVEPLFEFRPGLALSLYEQRKKFDLPTHLNAVDSELSCPVLVTRELSAASGFVPVGMWAGRSAVHISTGPPPLSGVKRRTGSL